MAVKNVWQDDRYDYSGSTLHFCIKKYNTRIYEGECSAEDFPIAIYPNRVAQAFLGGAFDGVDSAGTFSNAEASADFSLMSMTESGGTWVEDQVLYSVTYVNGYAGQFNSNMSEPINGRMDPREKMFYTSYHNSATTVEITAI